MPNKTDEMKKTENLDMYKMKNILKYLVVS